jgi:ubiquitin-protein ligase
MIRFSCGQCGKLFSLPDDKAGRQGKCKACGAVLIVPFPGSSSGLPGAGAATTGAVEAAARPGGTVHFGPPPVNPASGRAADEDLMPPVSAARRPETSRHAAPPIPPVSLNGGPAADQELMSPPLPTRPRTDAAGKVPRVTGRPVGQPPSGAAPSPLAAPMAQPLEPPPIISPLPNPAHGLRPAQPFRQPSAPNLTAPPPLPIRPATPPLSEQLVVPQAVEEGPSLGQRRLSVRERRLTADAEMMFRIFRGFPLIQIRSASGSPPELYQVEYYVRGLARGAGGQPIYRDQHLVQIQLTREYPYQSPKCVMVTPIFHPNFDPTVICVGDHWTAGERLVDLVVRIGEMIAYQAYNIRSPLDGEAAMWADLNRHYLPTDPRDLIPPGME